MPVRPTRPAHYEVVRNRLSFQDAYYMVQNNPEGQYHTHGNGVYFTVKASITTRGPHKGKRVLRFFSNGKERARAYDCCWGYKTNCNRTYIDCYTKMI